MTYTPGMRATQASRYERYRELRTVYGESCRMKWTVHLADLESRAREDRRTRTGWAPLLDRLSSVTEHHLFWVERFTPDEVHAMARGMHE